ncbi:MAG: cell division ATP-binding protein FtsE [Alphaproteobacteria bacterium]
MRYGTGPEILREITFSLKPGSFHFLTGRSGAGKSSLLKLIYLAHRPSRGLVTLFDEDIATIPRHRLPLLRRKIGVVFQEFRMLSHLSAFDNVALPLRVAGVRESTVRKNVEELLAWTGLADHMDARPPTLSGGQQQRVAIARAIIARPSLLLADEPTGNVDDALGVRLLYLFEELNRMGTTVVIATHSEALISRFEHSVLQLEGGTLVHREPAVATAQPEAATREGKGFGDRRTPAGKKGGIVL